MITHKLNALYLKDNFSSELNEVIKKNDLSPFNLWFTVIDCYHI